MSLVPRSPKAPSNPTLAPAPVNEETVQDTYDVSLTPFPSEGLEPTPPAKEAKVNRAQAREERTHRKLLKNIEMLAEGSQSAIVQEWHREGRIFGVTLDGSIQFPAFQFDGLGQPIAQMSEVLKALGKATDWDYLHWFLKPTYNLAQKTPLEVWTAGDRRKVLELAAQVRWE